MSPKEPERPPIATRNRLSGNFRRKIRVSVKLGRTGTLNIKSGTWMPTMGRLSDNRVIEKQMRRALCSARAGWQL